MADVAHSDIGADLVCLLQELLQTWPAEDDLNYVHVYLDHGEYEEALDNLIAVGLRGASFTPDQVRRVTNLATSMGVEGSPMLHQLHDAYGQPVPTAGWG